MGLYRKVIKIRGEDSPNVRYAMAQISKGQSPDHTVLIPGVLPFADYVKRMQVWPEMRITIGIKAEFYEGASVYMYPPMWLDRSEAIARTLSGRHRKAKALGVDPAEGGDSSAWSVVDELGLIFQQSLKTPDTTVVVEETKRLIHLFDIPHEKVLFDAGGGGKQHADRLIKQGYNVDCVGFGRSVTPEMKRGMKLFDERKEDKTEQYTYAIMRDLMYGTLREMLDPVNATIFALPEEFTELRKELSPIPLTFDVEGRFKLPPKKKPNPDSKIECLIDIIGHSPDLADSLVLAIHAMVRKDRRPIVG